MKGHRTDGVSLTFAVIFLAIAAWWLLAQVIHLALPAVGWIVAGALILLGMFGLLGALRSGASAGDATGTGPADDVDPAVAPVTAPGEHGPA